ncbi:MAG: hypothetical protein QXD89_01220 [Candidatus Aenigmatarchaeota archaeon]|jgi:hypothetical protein
MQNLPGIGQLIKESFYNFKTNFINVLFVQLPIIAIIFLIFGLWGIFYTSFSNQIKYEYDAIKYLILPLTVIISLAFILSTFAYRASILKLSSKELRLLDVYKASASGLISFCLTLLLSGLIIFVGFLLFIIPGVILFVRFYFVPFVASLEGIYYRSALRKSSEYVKGLWWKVFARILILVVLLFVVSVIFYIILFILGKISPIIPSLLSIILNYAIHVFSLVYMFTLYNQIKNVKRESNLE